MEKERLPFGLSWNQIYFALLAVNALVVILFLLFTKYFS